MRKSKKEQREEWLKPVENSSLPDDLRELFYRIMDRNRDDYKIDEDEMFIPDMLNNILRGIRPVDLSDNQKRLLTDILGKETDVRHAYKLVDKIIKDMRKIFLHKKND